MIFHLFTLVVFALAVWAHSRVPRLYRQTGYDPDGYWRRYEAIAAIAGSASLGCLVASVCALSM